MTGIGYDSETVETINGVLDEIELRPHRDKLVVVGGSALAAWGVKPLGEADLDLVITRELRNDLWNKPHWWESDLQVGSLDYNPPVGNGIQTLMPPFRYAYYPVTAEEFVAEGLPCGQAGYLYSPLYRILDVKKALSSLPVDPENKTQVQRQHKHWQDVMLIVKYFFDNCINLE